jgi:hypothetical protein
MWSIWLITLAILIENKDPDNDTENLRLDYKRDQLVYCGNRQGVDSARIAVSTSSLG